MKLLIIGDNPSEIGGVANYTRPLFAYMKNESDVDVSYLFTSSHYHDRSFFTKEGIVKVADRLYEYKNCPIVENNYDFPEADIKNTVIEHELSRFLNKMKFDVVHINCMLCLPISIHDVIKQLGIKLFVTVHEYWWLCPYRVMVDYNKLICPGPTSYNKCAYCSDQKPRARSIKNTILVEKLKNDFPFLLKLYSKLIVKKRVNSKLFDFSPSNVEFPTDYNPDKALAYKRRLEANIRGLNICDKVIAVSSDVKRILMNFGVKENIILVQHIGSIISEKHIRHTKPIDSDNVIFGFIGGVTYYKGVHVLAEAFSKLPENLKQRSRVVVYGKYNVRYKDYITNTILSAKDNTRFSFFGRYNQEDLHEITNSIDISVLPSLCADTAPQTIFESFSAGLPIIAPTVGGFSDFIEPGKNGFLYDTTSDDLSKKMEMILLNPGLIETFKTNIPKLKTMRENVSELIDLYNA